MAAIVGRRGCVAGYIHARHGLPALFRQQGNLAATAGGSHREMGGLSVLLGQRARVKSPIKPEPVDINFVRMSEENVRDHPAD